MNEDDNKSAAPGNAPDDNLNTKGPTTVRRVVSEPIILTSSASPETKPEPEPESELEPEPELTPEPIINKEPTPPSTGLAGEMSIKGERSNNGKKKIGLIALIAAAVLLIAAVLVYFLWYQNKDKVVTDAIGKVIYAETVAYDVEFKMTQENGASYVLTVDGSSDLNGTSQANIFLQYTDNSSGEGIDLVLTGEVVTASVDEVYIKVDGVEAAISSALESSGATEALPANFNDIIQKIDGQWLKITSDDLTDALPTYSDTQKCLSDVLSQWQNKTTRDELVNVYKKNPFVVVGDKIGEESGSVGYNVTLSLDKTKSFTTDMKETVIQKTLSGCDTLADATDTDSYVKISDEDNAKTEVWISKFQHDLTKLSHTATENGTTTTVTLRPVLNKPVNVNIPSDARSAAEVFAEITTLFQSYSGYDSTYDDSIYDYDYDYDYEEYDVNYDTDYAPVTPV
jgi:hypothetical protein